MKTILHEQDGFSLEAGPNLPRVLPRITPISSASWIYHWCPGEDSSAMVDCLNGQCCQCMAPIPDEIWGLWKLHNFDQIQKGWL